jgi:drug/metabolite transporter (DMT)-like permease
VRARASRPLLLAAFAAVYVLWGSTYLAIRFAVETVPPFLLAGIRFTIAGAILGAFALAHGAARPTRENWKAAAIAGTLLFPLGNGVVVWAETRIDSSMAALLVATEPFWVVLLLWLRAGVRPRPFVIAGIVAGFGGLIMLVGRSSVPGAGAGADVISAAALVGASISWAAGSLYARKAPLARSPLLSAATQMIAGGVALLLLGAATGEPSRLDVAAISTRSILAFGYLVIFGSLIGFSAYSWLVTVAPPARVATYAYVNPVIAVLLGWLLAGEAITVRIVIAAAVIVGAVALIVADQSRGTGGLEGSEVRALEGDAREGAVRSDGVSPSTRGRLHGMADR